MRDKLIELIKSRRDPCDIGACPFTADDVRPCSLCETESLADHLISHGVTFAKDNNVPCKWIPVSERLPDTGGTYLIYGNVIWTRRWLSNFDKELGKFGSWWDYEPDGTKHERYRFIETEVTHWMPLPEPPKEGNNE